jgi:hypothetical protein
MLRPTPLLALAIVLGACSAGDASSDWIDHIVPGRVQAIFTTNL